MPMQMGKESRKAQFLPAFERSKPDTRRQDGLVTETYQRVGVREALMRLASAGLDRGAAAAV